MKVVYTLKRILQCFFSFSTTLYESVSLPIISPPNTTDMITVASQIVFLLSYIDNFAYLKGLKKVYNINISNQPSGLMGLMEA